MVENRRQVTPFELSSLIAVTTPALPVDAFAQGRGLVPSFCKSAEEMAFLTVVSSELASVLPRGTVLVLIERSTLLSPKKSKLDPMQPHSVAIAENSTTNTQAREGDPFV